MQSTQKVMPFSRPVLASSSMVYRRYELTLRKGEEPSYTAQFRFTRRLRDAARVEGDGSEEVVGAKQERNSKRKMEKSLAFCI